MWSKEEGQCLWETEKKALIYFFFLHDLIDILVPKFMSLALTLPRSSRHVIQPPISGATWPNDHVWQKNDLNKILGLHSQSCSNSLLFHQVMTLTHSHVRVQILGVIPDLAPSFLHTWTSLVSATSEIHPRHPNLTTFQLFSLHPSRSQLLSSLQRTTTKDYFPGSQWEPRSSLQPTI